MKLKFGQVETETVIDTVNGSTETKTENYRDGQVVMPIRRTYRIRHLVRSKKEEYEEYAKFSDEIVGNKSMFDPDFKIDKKPGKDSYYVIWIYTVVEY